MKSWPRHSLDACYRQDNYARAVNSSAVGHNTIIQLNPIAIYADQSAREKSLGASVVKESVELRNVS